MTFDAVDPVISQWAKSHDLKLFAEESVRYCWTSSDQECFQIVIRSPQSGTLLIETFSVDTIDNEELHASWEVHIADLGGGLEQALQTVEAWKHRNG